MYIQNLAPGMGESLGLDAGVRGILVADLAEGSPAQKAGLKEGDVITKLDGSARGGIVIAVEGELGVDYPVERLVGRHQVLGAIAGPFHRP